MYSLLDHTRHILYSAPMTTKSTLECIEITPSTPPTTSVIWLHGLGADGNDFVPIIPTLDIPAHIVPRFIFPHAPIRPVTLNGGMPMRAWHDILALERDGVQDRDGILESTALVTELIDNEIAHGMPSQHIIVAGFSQGGACALRTGLQYPRPLGGIIGLSCYFPLAHEFNPNAFPENQNTPILLAHGHADPVVQLEWGQAARDYLTTWGYKVTWQTYPIEHNVNMEECRAIGTWIAAQLSL